jgi:predicted esterase
MGDPHASETVLQAGVPIAGARLVVIMAHGRGAAANDMIALAGALRLDGVAFLAPQARDHTWYPYSFLSPIDANEPGLTSGLRKIGSLVANAAAHGIETDRVALLGFSQGACLALEYAARHARRYAAVIGLSGGLIGPPGTARDYAGSFDGTPAFLGCSDIDPHIPLDRVHETAKVLRRMGASVDERIYPRMGHTVNHDEIAAVRALLG